MRTRISAPEEYAGFRLPLSGGGERDHARYVKVVTSLRAEVCSLCAELLRHPAALPDSGHHSLVRPFFVQAVNQEVLSLAMSTPLQVSTVSSPSALPVNSVPMLSGCPLPIFDKKR